MDKEIQELASLLIEARVKRPLNKSIYDYTAEVLAENGYRKLSPMPELEKEIYLELAAWKDSAILQWEETDKVTEYPTKTLMQLFQSKLQTIKDNMKLIVPQCPCQYCHFYLSQSTGLKCYRKAGICVDFRQWEGAFVQYYSDNKKLAQLTADQRTFEEE
jgi:hypothetical protein